MFILVIGFFCYYHIHHPHLSTCMYTQLFIPRLLNRDAHIVTNSLPPSDSGALVDSFHTWKGVRTKQTDLRRCFFLIRKKDYEKLTKSSEHKIFLLHWYLCKRGSTEDVIIGLPYAHLFAVLPCILLARYSSSIYTMCNCNGIHFTAETCFVLYLALDVWFIYELIPYSGTIVYC